MTSTATQNNFSISNNTSMPTSSIPQKMNLRIRVFHVSDYPEIAINYHRCQQEVLKEFGVDSVSSIKDKWWDNPYSYMFIVEDINTGEIGAGMRVDVIDESHSIPVEEALKNLSPDITERAQKYSHVLGEVCGLWVKKSFSERDLPSHLLRSVLCVAPKLRIEYLVALLPKHTMGIFSKLGFDVVKSIGNEGEFFYPDQRYISTVMELQQVSNLERLNGEEAEMITWLKSNPKQILSEVVRKDRETKIKYDLRIM